MRLTALLRATVAADPASVAVIDAGVGATSRAELWRRVVVLRDELRARGVGPGDGVAVWMPNWSDAVVWQFAVAGLGAHVVGVNTRYGPGDVAHVLAGARPRVVALAHGFLDLDLLGTLRAALRESGAPAPAVAVVAEPGADAVTSTVVAHHDVGGGSWAPARGEPGPLDLAALDDAPDGLAVAFTTSGSTGRPKLAAHRGSALAGHLHAVARTGAWDESSVALIVYPFSGVFGYVGAMTAVTCGGAALMEPVFAPELVLEHMREAGVTHLAAADDITTRLMAAWRARPVPLPAFAHLLLGDFHGSSAQVATWAEQELGTTTCGIYGSSELFALIAFRDERDPLPTRWRAGGRLVSPETEVRVVSGELQFRGPVVVDAYLGDEDGAVAARSFTEGSWFRSGDLGTVHDDGSFDFRCRAGDAIRLRGFLVEPVEIEARLCEHADVARAKVVGVDRGGETRAVAFVEPVPGREPDPAALRAWCAAALAAFKVPDAVHPIPELPTTAGTNGAKVRADVLRERAAQMSTDPEEEHRP